MLFPNEINETKDIKVANEMASQMPTTPEMKHSPITDWNSLTWLCYLCEESFKGFGNLSTHQESYHKDRNKEEDHFICFDCKETLSEYSIFLNHIRCRHYNSLKLCCDVCNTVLPDYAQLAEHLDEHIEYADEIHPAIYHCNLCEEVAATQKILKLHVQEYHDLKSRDATQQNDPSDVFVIEEFKFECSNNIGDESVVEDCVKYEEEFKDTEDALKEKGLSDLFEAEEVKFECPDDIEDEIVVEYYVKCEEEYNDTEDLLQCGECVQNFKTEASFKRHMAVHNSLVFICPICSKLFNSDFNLKRHMNHQHSEQPLKCDVCFKTFKLKVNLKHHMITHYSERPFQCNVCSKTFKFKQTLNRHMAVHISLVFICPICSKLFNSDFNLKRHMKHHNSELPFK